MRKLLIYLFCTTIVLIITTISSQSQKLTNELIWGTETFKSDPKPEIIPLANTSTFAHLVSKSNSSEQLIVLKDFESGLVTDTLFDTNRLPKGESIDKFSISSNQRFILISTSEAPVFRHSSRFKYYLLYNDTSQSLKILFDGNPMMCAGFSPDNKFISYIDNYNISLLNLENLDIINVTTDGSFNETINGMADWVYEEEFAFHKGYEWSSDSKYLAYLKFDDSYVPLIELDIKNDSLFSGQKSIRYPRTGQRNPNVNIHLYNTSNKKTKALPVSADNESYIPRIQWQGNTHKLAIFQMNRLQNEFTISKYDVFEETLYEFYKEFNKKYIELPEHTYFTSDGSQLLITNSLSQYQQLYLYSTDTIETQSITLGKYDIGEVYGIDEINGKVYFQAAIKDPMNKLIYSADLNSFKVTNIGPSEGYCSAVYHSGQNYLQIEHSTISTPEIHAIYTTSGVRLYTLVDNIKIWNSLPEYKLSNTEFLIIRTLDKVNLNAWVIKPADFDANKKHPLLIYMYGGPGSQTVLNKWNGQRYMWHQMMAQKGYIIVSADNRGTGSRGEAFNKQVYRNLGELEAHDQIEIAKYFGSKPYINKDQISAWGWSFGGYLSSMLITKGHEYFNAAVAVAPVTNWKFYDSIYTERYMDEPKNNEEGYMKTAPINYAELMTGSLLLIHGTADDNVHYQNSEELNKALIENKKDIEFLTIPDEAHSLKNSRQKVYSKMTEFLDSKLLK